MRCFYIFIIVFISFFICGCESNTQPTCEIITPISNEEFEVGALIEILIKASDSDGKIEEVRIEINGIEATSLREEPYEYNWESGGELEGEYTIKAVAVDNDGDESYSFIDIVLVEIETGIFEDARDGREYKWVTIGKQVWMAENLAYLPRLTSYLENSDTEPCFYVNRYWGNNIEEAIITENYNKWGVLYNWPAALVSCPEGWHLPSYKEWEQLAEFIGKYNSECQKVDNKWYGVGNHLKASGTWANNENDKDSYGFTALPSGAYFQKEFSYNESYGLWWTATEINESEAAYRLLTFRNNYLSEMEVGKGRGLAVRCIKD